MKVLLNHQVFPTLNTDQQLVTYHKQSNFIHEFDVPKLKVAGESYSVLAFVVSKGDKMTVHFYNVDDVKSERH